jgi:hypothetical protein
MGSSSTQETGSLRTREVNDPCQSKEIGFYAALTDADTTSHSKVKESGTWFHGEPHRGKIVNIQYA